MKIKKLIETGYIDDVKYEIYKARDTQTKNVTYEVTLPPEHFYLTTHIFTHAPSIEEIGKLRK